jgi:hypothetical protein
MKVQFISKGQTLKVQAPHALLIALLAYCAASFVHFAHNATYIDAYPNLPPSLTTARVYLAWFAEAALGALGYVLYRFGARRIGLALIAVYAVLGFDGLAHYALAPISAHTLAMNLTIWGEVIAAAAVLVVIVRHRFVNIPS